MKRASDAAGSKIYGSRWIDYLKLKWKNTGREVSPDSSELTQRKELHIFPLSLLL